MNSKKNGSKKRTNKIKIKKTKAPKKVKKIIKKRKRSLRPVENLKQEEKMTILEESTGLSEQTATDDQSHKNSDKAGTGISSFDEMIEGGFERDSINLIIGGSGSGKTIFSLQFLLDGAMKGEKTLYVTFEEKKEEFYENMGKFGWDLEKLENSGNFVFLEHSPEKVKMMLDEGGGDIETIIFKNKIKRMVIDSVTSFSLLFEDDFFKRQAIIGLFDLIRKWKCTTLLTVQHNPSEKKGESMSSVEFEADSVILLYYLNIKNKRERFIEVLKMRGTDHSKEIHSFDIGEKGIIIGQKTPLKREILKD